MCSLLFNQLDANLANFIISSMGSQTLKTKRESINFLDTFGGRHGTELRVPASHPALPGSSLVVGKIKSC